MSEQQPAPVALGEGSLRITVRDAIPLNGSPSQVAVAAILAVADWLQRNPLDSTGLSRRWALATAKRLRREVGNG